MKAFEYTKIIPMKNHSVIRVLSWGESVMLREEIFEKAGSIVLVHTHKYEQITHVIKGRIAITNEDGVQFELGPKDSICFAPNECHGFHILEDNTIVFDAFSPCC